MTPSDDEITEAMLQYGGSFVQGLGGLFRRADAHNRAILRGAFAHYWREYEELLQRKWRAATHCPRCGSYTWTYQGGAQVCADCGQ